MGVLAGARSVRGRLPADRALGLGQGQGVGRGMRCAEGDGERAARKPKDARGARALRDAVQPGFARQGAGRRGRPSRCRRRVARPVRSLLRIDFGGLLQPVHLLPVLGRC